MHNDAGMMIVPTDEAVEAWWEGTGKELQDEYHYLDSVPASIIAELLNVNMKSSFSSFVPSKFASVLTVRELSADGLRGGHRYRDQGRGPAEAL